MSHGLTRRALLRAAGWAVAGFWAVAGTARAQEWAHAIHRATRNTLRGAVGVRLRRAFEGQRPQPWKSYPDAKRSALPAAETEPARPLGALLRAPGANDAAARTNLGLATLTRLLEAANGVTGQGPGGVALRAAPSAGALYAGELYVAVEAVEGLASGLYYYAPLTRELALLRPGPQHAAIAEALERPAEVRRSAAAVFVTSVFPRYRWRYANRGYRYALIDAGHIGENLRLAAASAGLAVTSPSRFHDDRLHALLDVDGIDEALCALHLVGSRSGEDDGDEKRRFVEVGASGRPLPAAADDAPERYHAATKLVPAETADATARRSESKRDDDASERAASGPVIALPRRDAPATTVEAAIRKRRSAHHFASEPVKGGDLGFALHAALGSDPPSQRSVDLYVFVHRAEGLPAGLYRARRSASGWPELLRLRSGDFSAPLEEACLGQENAARAAAGIAAVGRIEPRGADRDYRDLCLEAGALAQRLYLAAESIDLAARNLSAFVDDRLNALAGLDGRRRAVLHLTMLGPGD